jgi:uncharacterized repeat protein (TIGR02543 family)
MPNGTTDANGNVTLTLPATGIYTATIMKTGYNTGGGSFTVQQTGQTFTWPLTPTAIVYNQVVITTSVQAGSGTIAFQSSDGQSGTTKTSKPYTINVGSNINVLATPDAGYVFDHWTTANGVTSTMNPFVSNNVQNPASLAATFTPLVQNVQVTIHVQDSTTGQPISGATVSVV